MRISFLAALAAATALIPAAAQAQNQDRGGWQHGGDRGDRGNHGDRGNRGGQAEARPAAPARPQYNGPANARPEVRPQFPSRPQAGQYARPDRPNVNRGFDRPTADRPAQARPNGNWHAQAGGSHYGDRPDHNDGNRGQRTDGQWSRGQQTDGQWNRDRGNDRGGSWNRDGRNDRNGNWNRDRGNDHGGNWNRGDRGWRGDQGRFDHNWRRNDRYDWRDYRVRNRSAFHLPRYYAPYGWDYGYRRFGIGFRLDSILFGSNYWISDPYYYRLPPAYGPYRWVRYYNDALLVDIDTGEVVDVVYDIFW